MGRIRVSIVGGSGYTGGELLRLLLGHPAAEIVQVTSERRGGKRVTGVHPNLRKRTDLKFVSSAELEPCDVLFLALPHGASGNQMERFMGLAPIIIDLSADFRLRDAAEYPRWYGHEHPRPELLDRFVYGIPELHREEMRTANYISSAGCLATPTILGPYRPRSRPAPPAPARRRDRRRIIQSEVGPCDRLSPPAIGIPLRWSRN